MAASITTDGGSAPFEGWVGFISPMAEFTPKTVQTEELRSSLVYEIRVFVKDPNDSLRLGMPATVRLNRNSTTVASNEKR
jgi:HlyD family secretion protein